MIIYEVLNKNYSVNEWKYFEINFKCNPNPCYWNISMDGIQVNDSLGNTNFEFRGNPANFSRFQILTTTEGKDYKVYFDDNSWEPINLDNERILLNDITKLIYFLTLEKINYFIMTKQNVNEFQELIDYFYKEELYGYGDFLIYGID